MRFNWMDWNVRFQFNDYKPWFHVLNWNFSEILYGLIGLRNDTFRSVNNEINKTKQNKTENKQTK